MSQQMPSYLRPVIAYILSLIDKSLIVRQLGGHNTIPGGVLGPHHASHENGGSDELSVAGLSGLLADAQTPAAHAHTHTSTTGQTTDDHHAKAHNHTTADGSGVLTNDEHDGYEELAHVAKPGNPAAGKVRLYPKSDKKLYLLDEAGAETDLTAGGAGGSVAADPIWDALGDTVYGTGADTATKLAGNTTTTRKFLRQVGDGGASAAPAWDTLVAGDLPATAVVNPMTAQDDVIVGGAVTGGVAAPDRLGKGTDGQVLTVSPSTHHLIWKDPASGGGAASIYTSARASPPASPAAGDLWLPSDSFYQFRYSGAVWVPWGPIWPLVEPLSANFAWVNQGGSSVDATNGGLYLSAPAAASYNLRILKQAAPATPYTITAMFRPSHTRTQSTGWGLCFRQSSDGKLACLLCQISVTPTTSIYSIKFTNPTTWSATYATIGVVTAFPDPLAFWRLADDGANRIISYSADGVHFQVLHSIGRTDFLTADEVGFVVDAGQVTSAIGLQLLSWQVA